jgi:hypothetical protein
VFPDVEQLLVDYLDGVLDERVLTDLPANLDDILPVVRITRVSGADNDFKLDRPIVDVDAYASDRAGAFGLARRVQALLRFELPTVTCPGGVVTAVSTIVGPRWLPDTNTNLRRVQATYELVAHAPAGA